MSLYVNIAGHWIVAITHWTDSAEQQRLRRGWEQQGCKTELRRAAMQQEAAA